MTIKTLIPWVICLSFNILCAAAVTAVSVLRRSFVTTELVSHGHGMWCAGCRRVGRTRLLGPFLSKKFVFFSPNVLIFLVLFLRNLLLFFQIYL